MAGTPDADAIEAMAKATRPGANTKTAKAFAELVPLLRDVVADQQIDDAEFIRLVEWQQRWKTVLSRPRLAPFADWLEGAVADGVIDDAERADLIEWTTRLGGMSDADAESEAHQQRADDLAWQKATEVPRQRDWKKEPASPKQIALLISFGIPEDAARACTKGAAGAIIGRKIAEERATREASRPVVKEDPDWWVEKRSVEPAQKTTRVPDPIAPVPKAARAPEHLFAQQEPPRRTAGCLSLILFAFAPAIGWWLS